MKTTIELSESIYCEVAAYAKQNGKTVDVVLEETISERFAAEEEPREHGWRSVFGKADKEAVAEVQRIIDEEFSKINPEDWK